MSDSQIVRLSRSPLLGTNRGHTLLGYELAFEHQDVSEGDSSIIRSLITLGLTRIVGDARAFIKFTWEQLDDDAIFLLPAETIIIEIGPEIWRDMPYNAVIETLRAYRRKGYRIALDNFTFAQDIEEYGGMLDIVSFVKIDMQHEEYQPTLNYKELMSDHYTHIIATNVDTDEHYQRALRFDVQFVQGFYFAKPSVVQGRDLQGFKITYLTLINETSSEEVDFKHLAEIIKHDVALSYKLLRFVNSSAFGLRGEVESVTQALALMGIDQIRRWASAATISGVLGDRPDELARLCVVRARFCESLSVNRPAVSYDCFTVGMFSLLDVMLGMPMADAINDVPMSQKAREALMGGAGILTDIKDLAIAYEQGRWEDVEAICESHGWDQEALLAEHIDALEWSRAFFSMDSTELNDDPTGNQFAS